MRNIKITINEPQFPADSGLSHIATSWQVSRTTDFGDPATLLVDQAADTTNLLSFKDSIDVTTYDTIYVRTKYHFNDNKSSNWSRVTSLHGDQVEIVLSDVIIQTPVVDLKIDFKNNHAGELVLTTSPYELYTGAGEHSSTSWTITSADNEVLYDRKMDEDNLTKLILTADDVDFSKVYVINVKYHSNTGGVSNDGRYVKLIDTSDSKLYNLTMVKNFVSNRKLFFNLSLFTIRFETLDMIIRNENKQVVKSLLNASTMEPQLDTFDLNPYEVYTVYGRIKLDDGTYTPYKIVYEGILQQNYLNNYKPMINYLGKFDYTQQMLQNGFTVQNTSELYTGLVLLGKQNSGSVSKYKIINDKLIEIGSAFTLPDEHKLGLPYLNMIPLYQGDVIVNYSVDNEGGDYRKSVFKRYNYNPIAHSFSEVNSRINELENLSTSISNSAVVSRDGHIYYVPAEEYGEDTFKKELSLYKLNIDTFEITKVADLPFSAYRYVSLGIKDNGDLLIFGGSNTDPEGADLWLRTNNEIYNYNIASDTFSSVITLPVEMEDTMYNQQVVKRRDSKFVIFNAVAKGPNVGDQNTYIYDPEENTIVKEDSDYSDDQIYRNTVRLMSGNIIRISSKKNDPQNVYTYISDTMGIDNVDESTDLSGYLTNLVVSGDRVLTIEDPYMYETIVIEEGSTLRWNDIGNVREFGHKDLIVTRDTVVTRAEYESMMWQSVTILDGVTFVIT